MASGIASKTDPGPIGITALICAAPVTSIVSGLPSALRWPALLLVGSGNACHEEETVHSDFAGAKPRINCTAWPATI